MPWPARLAEYRKSSLGELLQAHLSMQAAIDSLPDPVAIFNIDGNLQNVNQAAETLLGLRTDGGVKEPFKNVDAVDTSRSRAHAQSRAISGKGAFTSREDSKTRFNSRRFWAIGIFCRAPRRSTNRAA